MPLLVGSCRCHCSLTLSSDSGLSHASGPRCYAERSNAACGSGILGRGVEAGGVEVGCGGREGGGLGEGELSDSLPCGVEFGVY